MGGRYFGAVHGAAAMTDPWAAGAALLSTGAGGSAFVDLAAVGGPALSLDSDGPVAFRTLVRDSGVAGGGKRAG